MSVEDYLGGSANDFRYILVSQNETKAFRFDFGSNTKTTDLANGFKSVGVEQYTKEKGYGFLRADSSMNSGTFPEYFDNMIRDYVELSKYPPGDKYYDGEFLVDLPNGQYTVLMHFQHRESVSFDSISAEGKKVVGKVAVKSMKASPWNRQQHLYSCEVNDGQLNIHFHRTPQRYMQWFVSGIEIIPGAFQVEEHALNAQIPCQPLHKAYLNKSNAVYDILGRKITKIPSGSSGKVKKSAGIYIVQQYDPQTGKTISSKKSLTIVK